MTATKNVFLIVHRVLDVKIWCTRCVSPVLLEPDHDGTMPAMEEQQVHRRRSRRKHVAELTSPSVRLARWSDRREPSLLGDR